MEEINAQLSSIVAAVVDRPELTVFAAILFGLTVAWFLWSLRGTGSETQERTFVRFAAPADPDQVASEDEEQSAAHPALAEAVAIADDDAPTPMNVPSLTAEERMEAQMDRVTAELRRARELADNLALRDEAQQARIEELDVALKKANGRLLIMLRAIARSRAADSAAH